ncbi:MAG: chromosomal replication initiator protein DnaA [Patescibacteria group bacterium]
MNNLDLFKAAMGELETTLSGAVFKTFFSTLSFGKAEGRKMEIVAPSDYVADQINKRFLIFLKNSIDRLGKESIDITFRVEKKEVQTITEGLPLFTSVEKVKQTDSTNNTQLSQKYTFETFIVGPSNRLAHAIATTVAENPGKMYNPFFLYAGVGLGKTHLIQAIGNRILKNQPKAKVVYATAESFMNELIETIQEGRNKNYTANKFRDKFRKADLLLIDDIQFIAGRGEATQEEFFHTFNALYMSQKQIVLTSDRPPKELNKLDARITSRFASGVVADMQNPDSETRAAILREKRNVLKEEIPNEVVDFIAINFESNIRELEGMFLQIVTGAKAEGVQITKEYAAKIIGHVLKEPPKVNINDILKTVCTYYNIKITDLKGKSRVKEFVVPRQISMYLLKDLTQTPFMVIGDILGGRDHTTIMHGNQKIENNLKENPKIKQDVLNIKRAMRL